MHQIFMVFRAIRFPVILADKNTPADVRSCIYRRLPLLRFTMLNLVLAYFVRILTKFLPYRKIEGCKKSLCRWTKAGCVFRVTGRCKGYKGVGSAADGGERLFPLLTGARQATPTAGALGERTRPYGVWSICAHPITGVNPYSRRYCLHSLRKTATRKIF